VRTTVQPDTISPRDLVCRLVSAGQCLLPLEPKPTATDIDNIISKLGKAFDIQPSVQIVARMLWKTKIGLDKIGLEERASQ
jgi:hypothetical protein